MSQSLRTTSLGDESEVRHAEETAFLGISEATGALFHPASADDAPTDWAHWLEREFAPRVAPHFVRVHQLASAFQLREIRDLDSAFGTVLDTSTRERSLAAATPFLDRKEGMRHHPEWKRMENWIHSGETPGHLPTLAALQAALFHLPLNPALLAYLRFEFRNGLASVAGGEALAQDRGLFEKGLPFVKSALREHSRFPGDAGDESGPENSLRAV